MSTSINVRRQRAKYIISDYLCLNIGWLLCSIVRYYYHQPAFIHAIPLSRHLMTAPVIAGQIVFPLMMVCLYWISGYYNSAYFKSRVDEFVNTAGVSVIGTIIIYFAAMINDANPDRMSSYEIIIITWALLFVPVICERLVITCSTAKLIRDGHLCFDTLVIGATRGAKLLVSKLSENQPGSGFNVVGFVDTSPNPCPVREDLGLPVYPIGEIADICRIKGIKRLIVAPHRNGFRETGELINALFSLDLPIFITPDLYGLIVMRPRFGSVTNEPMIDITHCHTKAVTLNLKRLSDIVIGSVACVALLPVYALIAIAIKRDSKGPVIYRQERIGYHKRPFYILKFRTMSTDAESSGPALTTLDDPRVTRIGHFLRKYRLDELPQFWNVVRGDMSLVGPRPERDYYIKQIVARAPYYNLIHQVRPGITSWGMVRFGYASDVSQMIERLRYDLLYIENVSLGVDLKILYHTVSTVLRGKGL